MILFNWGPKGTPLRPRCYSPNWEFLLKTSNHIQMRNSQALTLVTRFYPNTSLCKTYSFLFIWINKFFNFSTKEENNLLNISHILPSPLTFPSDLYSISYHDRNTGNKVCLGLYTYITKVVSPSRHPCYQFCIEDIREAYSKHTWDIYICISRFIYFRLAEFEETNDVLQYSTIIKHRLFLFWEEGVWVNISTLTTTYLVHLRLNSEVRRVSVVNLVTVNTMSVTHLL